MSTAINSAFKLGELEKAGVETLDEFEALPPGKATAEVADGGADGGD